MSGGGGEKTEKATPKKKKESRKEGQVARTPELGSWISFAAFAYLGPVLVKQQSESLTNLMAQCLRAAENPSTALIVTLGKDAFNTLLVSLVVLGCVILVISVAAALSQGGFYLATKQVKPSWKKFDLLQGTKRLFGPQAWWEGAKTLLKASAIGLVVYFTLKSSMSGLGVIVDMDQTLKNVSDKAVTLLQTAALAGVLLAAADYFVMLKRTSKGTKMTKEEVKQEHKQSEGDPYLKGAIRAKQIRMSRNRMMSAVADADVVLVNPTHIAVALSYKAGVGAPKVVAKGAGPVALKIREKAAEHKVAQVRDVPLARAIYHSVEVGEDIPTELFTAVAHILVFLMQQQNTRRTLIDVVPSPRPDTELPKVPSRAERLRQARRSK